MLYDGNADFAKSSVICYLDVILVTENKLAYGHCKVPCDKNPVDLLTILAVSWERCSLKSSFVRLLLNTLGAWRWSFLCVMKSFFLSFFLFVRLWQSLISQNIIIKCPLDEYYEISLDTYIDDKESFFFKLTKCLKLYTHYFF